MTRPTAKRLRYLIADERKASRQYRGYGFSRLARDESRHRRFLIKKLNRMQK